MGTDGIALAAMLLWGRSLWPAIWAAAFVANLGTEAPPWTAAAIATGNALEALAATSVLRRLPAFDPALRRVSDVAALIVVGAVMSTAISATIGVATLCGAGVQPWGRFSELWFDWWLGGALGALVFAPAVMTTARTTASRRVWVETGLFVIGAAVTTQVVFGRVFDPVIGQHPLEYVIFSLVIVAAVRLGQPATSLVVLAASGLTIWDTVSGAGPFAGPAIHENLILLEVFLGVLAGTGLLLAAAIAERKTSEQRRAAAYAVGEVLADTPDLTQAAPAILRGICDNLEWQIGALWLVDHSGQRLRCLSVWAAAGTGTTAFLVATEEMLFPSGVGLPGRVWASGKPAWIEDVVHDPNFPRAALARDAGIHGAFAFPICLDQVLGVIECFTNTVAAPDADLLRTMSTVGNQIGQFMGRKRGEIALVEGQKRTGAILDSALDAIIGMDHQGVITEFNPAAERTFGYSRQEALGLELAALLIPRHLRDRHRDGLLRYLTTGEGPFIDHRIETSACHADGREFPVEVSITRVPDDHPQPRFTGFVRDLTARVQAERERERLLERESIARREAETANRAKDDFLATLSHELRTPLNAIVGWTRMLLDGTMDERSTRRALQVIARNADLQAQLVSDILDVSRIITGGLRLDVRPVDLGSVIGAALDAVRPGADAKKIQLRSHLAAAARMTEGDPQRLQQIIWNLLANAVKFTPPGGTVDVTLRDAGSDGVLIRVADDGAGIDPEFLPHVFERFRQADGSVSRQHGGLGLGLAIVRHLAELHGGTVRAESGGPGQGSAFTIELPRLNPERAPASSAETRQMSPGGGPPFNQPVSLAGCRALVVDDDDDARELIAAILTRAGASVRVAASIHEGLAHLEAWRPDVLLADIGMPGADGYALIREIRKREAQTGRRLPAAAVTAYAGIPNRERALAAGFDRHLSKPIDAAAIVDAVRSMWSGGGGTSDG